MSSTSPRKIDFAHFNWGAAAYLFLAPVGAIVGLTVYISRFGVHPLEPVLFVLFYLLSGLGITAGYHRYYSHQSYRCHPIVQIFHLIFGAIALQQPVYDWARNHRLHHRYSDTDRDPHNIRRGFFWAHMGWVLFDHGYEGNYTTVKDLSDNRLVQWQRRLYWPIFVLFAIGLPLFLGSLYGRPGGALLWAGLLRIVLQSHATYAINSFAHTFGRRPHSTRTEARDSLLLALVSHGEGYHNYHHRFASDYRNGHLWHHWDPTKWFIKGLSYFGLTYDLKRAPQTQLLQAKLERDLQTVRERIASFSAEVQHACEERLSAAGERLEQLAQRFQEARQRYREGRRQRSQDRHEWRERMLELREQFQEALAAWSRLIHQPQLALA
ncbi:MAG: fatty acid desaturase [Planctomycetota bacterium]